VTPVSGPAPVAPVPVAPPAKRRSSGGGRLLNVVLVVAAAVAIGGVAFAAGRTTAPASAANAAGRFGTGTGNVPNASGRPAFGGANGQGGGRFGGGAVAISGTVQSVSGDTLTITTTDGRTIQFALGPSTTYATQTPAAATDVTTGSKVQVSLDLTNGPGGGFNNPQASAGPVGTAGSVTVVP
jgi:hypothetical protein